MDDFDDIPGPDLPVLSDAELARLAPPAPPSPAIERPQGQKPKQNGAHHPDIVGPPIIVREPPHSQEAEENLLSCCLIDGGETLAKADILPPAAFYLPANRVIFEMMREVKKKTILTIEALVEELSAAGQLDAVGGVPYLIQVSGRSPTTAQAGYFIKKVRELHLLREIIMAQTRSIEEAYAFSGDLGEFSGRVRARIDAIDSDVATQAPAFTIWGLNDFKQYVVPPDYVLICEDPAHPIWAKGMIGLLLGPPGVGKSRLTIQMAIDQILGNPWCGFDMPRPMRKWLVVGNENSMFRLKGDLEAMTSKLSPAACDKLQANLRLQVPGTVHDSILSLDNSAAVARLRATITGFRPDILVLDPWQSFVMGGDTNDSAAGGQSCVLLSNMMIEAGLSSTIMIVHHARTGAEAARSAVGWDAGSYAKGNKTIYGIARTAFNVAPGDSEDSGKLVLSWGKSNDAKRFEPRGLVLNEETMNYEKDTNFNLRDWQDDVEGKRSAGGCSIRDIIDAVNKGRTTTGEIADEVHSATGAGSRTIQRILRDACDRGYVAHCLPHGSFTLGNKTMPMPKSAPKTTNDDESNN